MARFIRAVGKFVEKISWFQAVVSMALVLPLIFVTVYSVLMRYVFRQPQGWVYDVTTLFMLVPIFAFALAYVLKIEGHVKVEILTSHLSPRTQRKFTFVAMVASVLFAGFALWVCTEMAWSTWESDLHTIGTYDIPLFPAYVLIPIGLFAFFLQSIVGTVKLAAQLKAKPDIE